MNNIFVSDVINEDYKEWKDGDFILINAGTGCGKSHFIKNTLYEHCKKTGKKILLISNRNLLKLQNEYELCEKLDIITCINYQKIEY